MGEQVLPAPRHHGGQVPPHRGEPVAGARGTHRRRALRPDDGRVPRGLPATRGVATGRVRRGSPLRVPVRQRCPGHGIYYRITAGGLAGWWVAEVPGGVVMLGRYDTLAYPMPRLLSLGPGTH